MLTKRQQEALDRLPEDRKIRDIFFYLSDTTDKRSSKIELYYEAVEGEKFSGYIDVNLPKSIYSCGVVAPVNYKAIKLAEFTHDELSKKLIRRIFESMENLTTLQIAISNAKHNANAGRHMYPWKYNFMEAIYQMSPIEMKLLFELEN